MPYVSEEEVEAAGNLDRESANDEVMSSNVPNQAPVKKTPKVPSKKGQAAAARNSKNRNVVMDRNLIHKAETKNKAKPGLTTSVYRKTPFKFKPIVTPVKIITPSRKKELCGNYVGLVASRKTFGALNNLLSIF